MVPPFSLSACTNNFFDRKEKRRGVSQKFSHSLRALIEDIKCAHQNRLIDPDTLVRDQFVVSLRRELKSIVRQNPSISFLALGQEAIRWAEEGERPSGQTRVGLNHIEVDDVEGVCHAVGVGRGYECSVLQEQVKKQQLQIESIIKSLSKLGSVLEFVSHSNKPNYQFTPEGLPFFLRCQKPGHVLCQCR